MTDYDATPALLAAANEAVRCLAEENRTLHEQIEAQGQTLARTLADHETEVAALRWAVNESEGRLDTAEMRIAELTRQRDSARSIAIRCGAFDSGAGTDYEAHHDRTWPMERVDPEGRLFK